MRQILWDFVFQTNPLIPAITPDLVLINQKKELACPVDVAIQANHRMKIREIEKIDNYLVFAES